MVPQHLNLQAFKTIMFPRERKNNFLTNNSMRERDEITKYQCNIILMLLY